MSWVYEERSIYVNCITTWYVSHKHTNEALKALKGKGTRRAHVNEWMNVSYEE